MAHVALIDCNNFFVSCERLFRPDLHKKPVMVLSSNDGCVISRSEEVKELGVRMGAPYFKVKEVCEKSGVTVFSSNFDLYRDLSRRVMETLRRFSDSVEVYSVDEAFLKIDTPLNMDLRSPYLRERGVEVRDVVLQETGIPVSVGIAPTKTLAKAATHFAKPKNGGTSVEVLITAATRNRTLSLLPVGEIWGVGWRLAPALERTGIKNALQLTLMPDGWIRKKMSVRGLQTVEELRGMPCYDLGEDGEPRKSLLHSRSFGSPVRELSELRAATAYHARKVAETLRAEEVVAREVGVTLRTSRHRTHDRYGAFDTDVLPLHTSDTLELVSQALAVLTRIYRPGFPYAKIGVMVRDIMPQGAQPQKTLFGESVTEREALMRTLDSLRARFGEVVRVGAEAHGARSQSAWYAQHNYLSPHYTTRWNDVPVCRKT